MKESGLHSCLLIFRNVSPHLSCLGFFFRDFSEVTRWFLSVFFTLTPLRFEAINNSIIFKVRNVSEVNPLRHEPCQAVSAHWSCFCGNKDFCLCCLLYSVIMAENPHVQSSEALEILIFILSSFQGFEIPRTAVLHRVCSNEQVWRQTSVQLFILGGGGWSQRNYGFTVWTSCKGRRNRETDLLRPGLCPFTFL